MKILPLILLMIFSQCLVSTSKASESVLPDGVYSRVSIPDAANADSDDRQNKKAKKSRVSVNPDPMINLITYSQEELDLHVDKNAVKRECERKLVNLVFSQFVSKLPFDAVVALSEKSGVEIFSYLRSLNILSTKGIERIQQSYENNGYRELEGLREFIFTLNEEEFLKYKFRSKRNLSKNDKALKLDLINSNREDYELALEKFKTLKYIIIKLTREKISSYPADTNGFDIIKDIIDSDNFATQDKKIIHHLFKDKNYKELSFLVDKNV